MKSGIQLFVQALNLFQLYQDEGNIPIYAHVYFKNYKKEKKSATNRFVRSKINNYKNHTYIG